MGTATYSAAVDANGDATIRVLTRSRVPWVVGQVSIEMPDAPSGATCTIRKNGAIITPMIATSDVAAGEPYILLNDTDTLSIEWENCTAGLVGKATVLFTNMI